MIDVEIVVFNDKSWVRFIEYQKLKEELKQEKQSLAKRIYELQSDLTREKVLHEQLKEHCDELELINQKVMEENEQLKQQIKNLEARLREFYE